MSNCPPVNESLAKLQAWMLENVPDVAFRPPANPAAVENFSEKSSLTLPDDLKQILLITDGETRTSAGAIGNWRIMPIAEIQAAWGFLSHLAGKGAFDELTPQPSPYLRSVWWHPGWIPIVSNDTGDYYCIDTNPPEAERSGQILLFMQNQPPRPLVAASLASWFDRVVRDLAAGVYTYDAVEGFNGEAFLWSSLEGKHLLDDVEGVLVVTGDD